MRRRLAKTAVSEALQEPTVIVFECCPFEFEEYVTKLITAIGPACRWSSEEEFCAYTGIAAEHLEDWLAEDWVQHFPHLVLSLQDVPGPVPWILYRIEHRKQQVRVFSASPDLARWSGHDPRPRIRAGDVRSPRNVALGWRCVGGARESDLASRRSREGDAESTRVRASSQRAGGFRCQEGARRVSRVISRKDRHGIRSKAEHPRTEVAAGCDQTAR